MTRARTQHGHNQELCASALVELGAAPAAQTTVSNWESGKTKRPPDLTIQAIEIYCGQVEDTSAKDETDGRGRTPIEDNDGWETVPTSAPRADEERFEETIAELTGAPPLNARQDQFLSDVGGRLRTGPAMSDGDAAVAMAVMRFLRLAD